MLSANTVIYAEHTFCYRDYVYRVSPCLIEITSLKTIPSFKFACISSILYTRRFWLISVLTKNLMRRKKVYIKVFLNWFLLILIIYNNTNSFLFLWLWIIILIILPIENILIYLYFDITWNRRRFSHWHFIYTISTSPIHIHTTSTFLHLHFISSHWAITFGFAKSFVHVMSCHLQPNFFLTSQKSDSVAGVDHLIVKNDVSHGKTIIPDRSQIHFAPIFLLLSS